MFVIFTKGVKLKIEKFFENICGFAEMIVHAVTLVSATTLRHMKYHVW